jgi:hypothetical protein
MEKKITKKEYFEMLKEIVNESNSENKGELIYFIESQIASIETKAAKAKERAAAKKAEGDALREAVKSVLTNEFQDAETITALVDEEDVTKNKVIARLTQLVNLGEVEKTDIKNESGKTRKAYKLI